MCEQVVCGQVLCGDKLCVSKLCVCASCVVTSCVVKLCVGRRRAERRVERRGCTTKNKNPTQRCGEIPMCLASQKPNIMLFTSIHEAFDLRSKNHGTYSVLWAAPSQKIPVFSMLQEVVFPCFSTQSGKNISHYIQCFGLWHAPKNIKSPSTSVQNGPLSRTPRFYIHVTRAFDTLKT